MSKDARAVGMVEAACTEVAGEALTLQQQCDTPSRMLVAMDTVMVREAQEYPGPTATVARDFSSASLARAMAAPQIMLQPVT